MFCRIYSSHSFHMKRIERFQLKEGAAGSSFSFSCMDASDSLSSSDVTKFVSLEIRGKVGGLEEKTAAGLAYQTKPSEFELGRFRWRFHVCASSRKVMFRLRTHRAAWTHAFQALKAYTRLLP